MSTGYINLDTSNASENTKRMGGPDNIKQDHKSLSHEKQRHIYQTTDSRQEPYRTISALSTYP